MILQNHVRRLLPIAICFLGFAPVSGATGTSGPQGQEDLRRICQELADAIAPGDVKVWRKYLDDRLIHVDENGIVRTKDQLLRELTPLPPGLIGSISIEQFKAETHGDVTVAAYEMQESLDNHGQLLHSRFRSSDTWIRRPDGWRLINQQISAVLKDPPAIELTQRQLCAYNGSYLLRPEIRMTVRCSPAGLTMVRTGQPAVTYLPEVRDVFFTPGQPRTRRIFERNARGDVLAFVERREGEDIRWTKELQ